MIGGLLRETVLRLYDGEGRLSQTTLAGVVTNLSYDGTELVAEYNSAGALLRRYVHGPGVDEPLVWYEGATTNKTWLYADHQGSIVATANAAGTSTATLSYGPYGEPNQTTGVRFRYTGQQLLGPLNLYYYKARFYSPAIGRFLQTDPIGYQDGLNLYAYVGNNPFNRNDPLGLTAAQANLLAGKIGGYLDTSRENLGIAIFNLNPRVDSDLESDLINHYFRGNSANFTIASGQWQQVQAGIESRNPSYYDQGLGSFSGSTGKIDTFDFEPLLKNRSYGGGLLDNIRNNALNVGGATVGFIFGGDNFDIYAPKSSQ